MALPSLGGLAGSIGQSSGPARKNEFEPNVLRSTSLLTTSSRGLLPDVPPQPCQTPTLGSLPQALTSLPPPGAPSTPAGLTRAPGTGLPHKPGHSTHPRAGEGSTRPSAVLGPSDHHGPHPTTAGRHCHMCHPAATRPLSHGATLLCLLSQDSPGPRAQPFFPLSSLQQSPSFKDFHFLRENDPGFTA